MKTSSLYPLLFDAIKDPLILVDQRGGVALANASALSSFDFGSARALRTMTLTEPDCVFDAREITKLIKGYDSVRDYNLKDSKGRDSGVSLDVDSVHDINEGTNYKLLHFRNRSENRQSELWRDEIISMVSHEIKNPLSAMKNSVDILLSQIPGDLTEGQKLFLNTSGRSIDRLTHMLDGFLDVSRINSGAFELKPSDVDMRQFASDVIRSFTTLFNVKRVKLDCQVDAKVNKGYIDSEKLEQVIINLLSNALKFTPENGEIAVAIGLAGVEALGDELRLLPWNQFGEPRLLEIVVQDNGLGMSSETLDNLFNRYHKTKSLSNGKGAHLGLNISKKLLEAQNGWLDIVSQLGLGTKVTVYIPQDRHTACVVSRMTGINQLIERGLGAHRKMTLFALGKQDSEDWEDIRASWQIVPAVNPPLETTLGETFHLWTINTTLAIAVILENEHEDDVEKIFGPQFIQQDDKSYVYKGCAIGACRAPEEASTLAQTCNIAMNRMDTAREAMIRSMTELAASGIESLVVDLGS